MVWFYALNRKVLYVLCLGEHSTKYLPVYPIFAWSYFKILQIRSSSVFSSSDLELWFYFYLSTSVWWFEQIELDALDYILIMLQINQG